MIKTGKNLLSIVALLLCSISSMATDDYSIIDSNAVNPIINVLEPSALTVCFNERQNVPVTLTIENLSNSPQANMQMGWYVNGDLHGSINWNDTIQPGSLETVIIDYVDFPGSGNYNITMWVAGSGGGFGNPYQDSVSINVEVLNPFKIDVLQDTTVCANVPLPLNLPPGYTSYEWASGETVDHKIAYDPGLHVVKVTDDFGCQTHDSIVITHYAAPGPLLPGDTVLCDGDVITLNPGSGFTYVKWNDASTSQTIDVVSGGGYHVTVTDTNGCVYQDSIQIHGASNPTAGISSNITFCQGDSAVITAASNYSSYIWNTGDTNNSITVTSSGNYIITVVGPSGCIGIDTASVYVNPLPDIQFSNAQMCNMQSFILDIGWFDEITWSNGDTLQSTLISSPGLYSVTVVDAVGCQSIDSVNVINHNVSVQLGGPDTTICEGVGASKPMNGYDSFIWNNGDTNGLHMLNVPGIHSVTVTNGGCTATDQIHVTIAPHPVADFSSVVASPSVEFTNLSNINTGLLWKFGDGTYSTSPNPIHMYSSNGQFTVTLVASNICSEDSITSTVEVYPQGEQNIYLSNKLNVYPTLSTDVVNFQLIDMPASEMDFMIVNSIGKLVYVGQAMHTGNDAVYTVDVSSFANGTYFIRVTSETEGLLVRPFVKQ